LQYSYNLGEFLPQGYARNGIADAVIDVTNGRLEMIQPSARRKLGRV
jgi:hypothetical protein